MYRPFVKWAGGKSRLLPQILPLLPDKISCYYEPFLGGGAVFFALSTERRIRSAVLSDANPDLVQTYTAVRDDVEGVIKHLKRHVPHATDPDHYYWVRGQNPRRLSHAGKAARFIYLNKTCFNGLYRVNQGGNFNVPMGRYKAPKVLDEDLLRADSEALKNASILLCDFDESMNGSKKKDAAYLDPPYYPISATSSFASYCTPPFRQEDHRRLAHLFRDCCERGVTAVLSNSYCPHTVRLYRGLTRRRINASRCINSNTQRRGVIPELIVSA